jgi:hypothetical protein
MEYLVFWKIGLGLVGALSAAIYLWSKSGSDTIEKPVETQDGDYVINKPENVEEISYDNEITTDAIKDPSGKPKGRPQ